MKAKPEHYRRVVHTRHPGAAYLGPGKNLITPVFEEIGWTWQSKAPTLRVWVPQRVYASLRRRRDPWRTAEPVTIWIEPADLAAYLLELEGGGDR